MIAAHPTSNPTAPPTESTELDNALVRAQEVAISAGLPGVCDIIQEARQALADVVDR